MEGRALPEAIENALRALFCEKNGLNMRVKGRGLGRFSFRPKSPQKGRVHLKHDFKLTEQLLPDSTMTYRGRSDGLVVESDRKSSFMRLKRILRSYIRRFFFPLMHFGRICNPLNIQMEFTVGN